MKIRIYYEDTDMGGIVYHPNYIKFCERARSEFFFQKGILPKEEGNSGFVVRNLEADFLGMAFLGDLLDVKSEILTIKNSSLKLKQEVFKDDKVIFSMNIVLVYIENKRPSKIPNKFIEIFSSI